MKPLNPEYPLARQTSHRRSADFCAPASLAVLLLACLTLPSAHASTLGRLFFTPQQRSQLDYAYARNAPAEGGASPVLTVNGIVQKHGGARTVWVNGVAQSESNSRERSTTTQTVTVPGSSKPVKLKVGEKILLDQSAPASQGTPAE